MVTTIITAKITRGFAPAIAILRKLRLTADTSGR
jgi:hypothetical protein